MIKETLSEQIKAFRLGAEELEDALNEAEANFALHMKSFLPVGTKVAVLLNCKQKKPTIGTVIAMSCTPGYARVKLHTDYQPVRDVRYSEIEAILGDDE